MAAETQRPLKVFLCHASGDKPQVRALFQRLVSEGVDAWLDEEKLLPGQDWDAEIQRALQESDAIVICLSKSSVAKEGYVQVEIKRALKKAQEKPLGTIYVIPAKLDDCDVPQDLKSWHWVDLFAEKGHDQLMRSLQRRATDVGATVDPLGAEELEQRLEQLYTEGLAAFYTEDWDKAYNRFRLLLRERPDHAEISQKLEEVTNQRRWKTLYTQALEFQKSEDWQALVTTLENLTSEVPNYKDAAAMLKTAQRKLQLFHLYEEARRLHKAEQWQAVIAVFAQIAKIDPNYPDVDRLKEIANQRAAEFTRQGELNELYSRAVREIDAGNWQVAYKLLKRIQKIQFGFRETEGLLLKVEKEVKKAQKPLPWLQKMPVIAKRAIVFLVLLAVVIGTFLAVFGLPIKYSLSETKYHLIYSLASERFVYTRNIELKSGDNIYLCKYDINSEKFLIAENFWGCISNNTIGWTFLNYDKFWMVFLHKQ